MQILQIRKRPVLLSIPPGPLPARALLSQLLPILTLDSSARFTSRLLHRLGILKRTVLPLTLSIPLYHFVCQHTYCMRCPA